MGIIIIFLRLDISIIFARFNYVLFQYGRLIVVRWNENEIIDVEVFEATLKAKLIFVFLKLE